MQRKPVLIVLAWLHFVVVVLCSLGWMWSAWWHTAAVGAVCDDLERQGVVDAAALPEVIRGYPTLGMHVQQGWAERSLGWGYALCLVAEGGSLIVAIATSAGRQRDPGIVPSA